MNTFFFCKYIHFFFIFFLSFYHHNNAFFAQTLAADIDSFYIVKGDNVYENKLFWFCSNQFNLARFVLEKSLNKGHTWEKLGEMPPANSNFAAQQPANYNFLDRFANRSLSAIYRLKTVENPNYLVDYFALIWNETNFIYATYQQQTQQLQISHSFGLDTFVNIKIYNTQQQLLYDKDIILNKKNIALNISLKTGFYIIKYDTIWQKLAVLY